MNTRKLLSAALVASAFTVIYLAAEKLTAQAISPGPGPSPGSTPPEQGPYAQIAMDDGTGVILRIRRRDARRVRLRAGQTATVVLQYDPSYIGLTLEMAALDGGTVTLPGNNNIIGPSGTVILQFNDAQQSGLYRLVANCGGTVSTLRFWVPAANDPDGDPSIIVPLPIAVATPTPGHP